METGKSYFFRDLIVKILLVLLFVFLLMWLFPMPNLNPLYDKIFTQNMASMTDTAKSYFTVSRLPQKEGETKKLTLLDMINNKMIIEFTDSEGKTCNTEESYVEVTKKNGEYIFKTNLVCGNESDYVIEYFGCYDVCEDGKCEVEVTEKPTETKKTTEYQFYKEVLSKYVDKYTCKDGYTLKKNKCVLVSEIEKQEDAGMKCLAGYSYNLNTNKCEKINTTKLDATLSCPTGYIFATSLNKCIKGTDDIVDATVSYKCEKGELVGNKCIISNINVLNATKVYSCSEGKLEGTKCIVTGTKEVDANVLYSCLKGTLSGNKCIIKNPNTCGYSKWVCSNKTYTTSISTSSTPTFTRKFLYQIGTSRVYEECSRVYSCKDGGTTTEVATKIYSCSEGKLQGSKCVIDTTKEEKANVSYKCEKGILNKSNMCEIVTISEKPASKVYSCAVGELNGTKCEIAGIDEVDSVYTCNYGVLSGKTCLVNTIDSKDVIYYCASGYTLADKKCYITENSTDITDATAVYKTKTEKVYKWSKSEKLEGWIRTGQTRVVNVAITSRG